MRAINTSGPFSRGAYFDDDLRNVTEAGVDHVMRLFFRHGTEQIEPGPARKTTPAEPDFAARARKAIDTVCEERLLDRG